MDINGLRLGNSIARKGNQNSILKIDIDLLIEIHKNPELFTPVIITEKILMDRGFKARDKGCIDWIVFSASLEFKLIDLWDNNDWKGHFLFQKNDKGCFFDTNLYVNDTIARTGIYYLHTLENLYFTLSEHELPTSST